MMTSKVEKKGYPKRKYEVVEMLVDDPETLKINVEMYEKQTLSKKDKKEEGEVMMGKLLFDMNNHFQKENKIVKTKYKKSLKRIRSYYPKCDKCLQNMTEK